MMGTDSGPDSSPDGASPADSGIADSGLPEDSGVSLDSGVPADSGVPMDSGAPQDTGVTTDSGVAMDSGTAASCPASAVVVGRPADYTMNTPRLAAPQVFVVRDARGFYALTSVCTHLGCDVAPSSGGFMCPCHSATYDLNGANTGGPAPRPLRHYAMCTMADGRMGVDKNTTVAADVRFNP